MSCIPNRKRPAPSSKTKRPMMSSRFKKTAHHVRRHRKPPLGGFSPLKHTATTIDKAHGRTLPPDPLRQFRTKRALPPVFLSQSHAGLPARSPNIQTRVEANPPRKCSTESSASLRKRPRPNGFSLLACKHWGIEAHHWIRDAVFGEDKSATRKGSAPVFMTLRRNLAIALLRLSGRDQIAGSLRFFSWNPSRAVSFLGV